MDREYVFITGGTGFVGMNIACTLLKKGYNVILYARKPPADLFARELETLPGTVFFEQGDVLDQAKIEEVIRKYHVSYFIHGAAITPDRKMEENNPSSIIEVNCLGLLKAVLASNNQKVKRFIYLGSISAYGETAFQEKMLSEENSIGTPKSLYEISKYAGEKILLRLKALYKMDAAVARIGDVYGPWERYTGVRGHMSLIYQLTSEAIKGGDAVLPRPCCQDWVCGTDIAEAVLRLMEAETLHYHIYPLCSGRQWDLIQWCRLLKNKYPDFSYSLALVPEEATIQVNQMKDNAAMSLDRLYEDTGFVPAADSPEKGFECYMEWLSRHPGFLDPDA
ncbi:MAG: NAD(P)-dependent oxidoreductase [Clostridium sp.]|nr:NAD(P)-dependent oxidoreductase [Clostridium sp.]